MSGATPCESCKKLPNEVNHPPGMIHVQGIGWQTCPACNGSGTTERIPTPEEEAEARGYAAAVADVVADLAIQEEGMKLMGKPSLAEYARALSGRYKRGAHVGAAKKGGG